MNWLDNRIDLVLNIDKKIVEIRNLMLKQYGIGHSNLIHFNELIEQLFIDLSWSKNKSRFINLFSKIPFLKINKTIKSVRFQSPVLSNSGQFEFPNLNIYDTAFNFKIASSGTDMWSILASGYFKEELIETIIILRLLKANAFQTFVDVGANLGYYSLLLASESNGINILSYEPDKNNYDLFLKSVKLNNFDTLISAKNYAIGEHCGENNLYLNKLGSGGHSLVKPESLSLDQVAYTVNTLSLDSEEFLMQSDKRIFIKIDVEGFEHNVFKGARKLLNKKNKPILFYESWPINSKDINNLLTTLGYKIYGVNNYRPISSHYFCATPLIDINNLSYQNNSNSNYFAFPPDCEYLINSLNNSIDYRIFTDINAMINLSNFLDNSYKTLTTNY
jgi:FkbM family methyltransferase